MKVQRSSTKTMVTRSVVRAEAEAGLRKKKIKSEGVVKREKMESAGETASGSGTNITIKKEPVWWKKEEISSDDDQHHHTLGLAYPIGEEHIEKIVDRRELDDKVQYLISWMGYTFSENTWEMKENLNCPGLIATYEEAVKRQTVEDEIRKRKHSEVPLSSVKHKFRQHALAQGFERGLEPELILGASCAGGALVFLMKWKGMDEDESGLVLAKDARYICPQIVIRFYETKLFWRNLPTEENKPAV